MPRAKQQGLEATVPLAHGSPGATLTPFPRPACSGGGGKLSFIGIVPPQRGSPGIGRVPAGFLCRRLASWLSPCPPHGCLRPGTVLLGERGQGDGVSSPHACPRWVAPAGLGAGGCCREEALRGVPCLVCQHSAPLLGTKSLALTGVAPGLGEFGCPIHTKELAALTPHRPRAGTGMGHLSSSHTAGLGRSKLV